MGRLLRCLAGLMASLVTAVVLSACDVGPDAAPDVRPEASRPEGADPVIRLEVDIDSCGAPWSAPHGGRLTFDLTNEFYSSMDVFLTNAATGGYLAEYEGIGTGATLGQTVTLGNGSYRFLCFPGGGTNVAGPTTVIERADPATPTTPELAPVSNADLVEPSLAYKRWITSRLPRLRRQVEILAADVRSGATEQAQADWLTAHLTYETLGAAYDAFSSGGSDFDGDINGAPAPGVDPATDHDLAGFHRLEALLWSGAPTDRLAPVANALVSSVRRLIAAFTALNIHPNDLPLRAHEIVENAVQFELNGDNDAGSHTNLATIWANLTGAQHALAPLEPLLSPRYGGLAATERLLRSTKALLLSLRRDGTWPALDELSEGQRARVNGALQRTVEFLAPVAAIGDMREVVPQ